MQKKCIIFDNEDQSEEIEKMKRDAKKQGIDLCCVQFGVGSTENDQFLTGGKIDIQKVYTEFKKEFGKGKNFHLAAFDWDLGDEKIDGVELIRLLNHERILENTPKLLYSGLLDDKLSGQLEAFQQGSLAKSKLLKQIKALIKIDIKDFVERDNYDQEIITILKKSADTLDFIIEKELDKFPQLVFRNRFVSESFQNKKFSDILVLIEQSDELRNNLKQEILEQVIAYMTKSYEG